MLKTLFFLLAMSIVFFPACEQETPTSADNQALTEETNRGAWEKESDLRYLKKEITVMTRNIYVGTDVDIVLGAENPEDIPLLVTQAFQLLLSTDIYERAGTLADEIAMAKPDFVGLQEVSLIRIQSPGDAAFGGTIPAEFILFDYLNILLTELYNRNLHYQVAGLIENADVELPMVTGVDTLGFPTFDDVRLTDYDVVLVKKHVQVKRVKAANFQVSLEIPTAGITIPRGYVVVDAKVGNKKLRFVNTHLEPAPIPEILPVQLAQAQELLKVLNNQAHPVIMVGDFNSVAPFGETYNLVLSAGFKDLWVHGGDGSEGFTFGHAPDLRNETVDLYERIDFVFARNKAHARFHGSVAAWVVGDELGDRTPSGLWPSDHAGVVATISFPKWHKKYALR